MRNILLDLISLLLFASCSPKYITKVDVQKETEYQVHNLRDSIYLHDSVYTFIHAAGDTIFVDRYKSTIKYKERLKTDTLRQVKEIVKTNTEIVEVKKKNNKFPTFVIGLLSGGLLLLILEICFYKK